jgi:signal transduction histidine kinase
MRYAAIFFVWLSISLLPASLHAQKAEKIERLKSQLAQATSDTAEIGILLTLAMTYEGYQMDSAMAYALKTLEKSERAHYTKGRADAMLHIGRLKRDQSKEVEALKDMFDALKLYREIGDNVQIANSLNDISIIYANSGDYKNSLDYFRQALEIFRQMGDEKGESYALNNMGIIYQEMKDEASAKDYFIQSLNIKIKRKDLYGISRGYTNLGSIAENHEAWDEAMRYYEKADSIYQLTNDKQVQGPNYLAMARVKQREGKFAEARKLAVRAFEISKEINALATLSRCSLLIAELDEKAKNYKSSLAYQKIYNQLADSLNNKNHKATLEELKAKFNVGEKEREIVLLKKDKELHEAMARNNALVTYTLSGSIAFLLLIVGLIYYAYRTTKTARDTLANKNKEIEQQNDDLDKLNKDKDRFFSILSHDLRSPLNSLKGLSYLLFHHADSLSADETKDIKKKVDLSLDNLTELINNILEWSMTTSKKRMWTFDKLNTSTVIQKNIALYQSIAASKGVRLVHSQGEDIFGYADFQAIDTVMRNLISNSIKFSHPDSDITVKATSDGNTVLISVQDQGIGMPADIQEKLFTMSSAKTQTGTKNEKGTGIGLLLCKELMKENNGDIAVKSSPGEGSEFFVSFPVFAG